MRSINYDKVLSLLNYTLLTLMALMFLYPFWNSVAISFNTGRDTALGGITLFPREFTLVNYGLVFKNPNLANAFFITIMRTLSGTVLSVLFTAMFGYAMSKKELINKKAYLWISMITMYFSGGLIPYFILIRDLHLINTFWVMVIPGIINVFNMIVFRSFFLGISPGLEESAKIDGCNYLHIFFRIILPVSAPIIATISLFTAVTHWNDWFTATIFIDEPKLLPIQSLLNQIINSNIMTEAMLNAGGSAADFTAQNQGVDTRTLILTTMVVATVPILMIYPFLQRYFVKGVMIGSLKE